MNDQMIYKNSNMKNMKKIKSEINKIIIKIQFSLILFFNFFLIYVAMIEKKSKKSYVNITY